MDKAFKESEFSKSLPVTVPNLVPSGSIPTNQKSACPDTKKSSP